MLLTQEILGKAVYRAIALQAVLYLAVTVSVTLQGSEIYPVPFLVASVAPFAACVVWCVLNCWGDVHSRAGVRALVMVSFTIMGTHLLVVAVPQGYAAHPPLYHLMAAGMYAAPFAFGIRAGAALTALFAVLAYWIRLPDVGPQQAVLESFLMAATGWACAALLHLLAKAAADVESATQTVWEWEESSARSSKRIAERQRWNVLIHDKVLGALRLAGRSRSDAADDAARELAHQALAALDGSTVSVRIPAVDETLRDQARRLALRLQIDIDDSLPDPRVREAFAGAATEALTNVARHSGQSAATVTGRLGKDDGTLHIVDEGCGFDLATRSARRLGLTSSIEKRMLAVGGSATISSTPGHGTVVTLGWSDTAQRDPVVDQSWSLRTFKAPFGAAATAALTLHVVMGWRFLGESRQPWITVAGMAVTVLLTLVLAMAPRMSPAALWATIAATAMPALMTVNLRTYDVDDYRTWYIGALDSAVILIAIKLSPTAGIISAVAMSFGVVLAQAISGGVAWFTVVTSCPQLLLWAALAGLCRRALNKSTEFIAQEASASGLLRLEAAENEEREAELARRSDGLGRAVVPLLQRVGDETPLTDDERRRCLALEASTRDQLVAYDVLSAELVEALREARDRGVVVEIAAQGDAQSGGVQVFREVCHTLLPAAPTGARVRALWRPMPDGQLATVTVVPPAPLSDYTRPRPRRPMPHDPSRSTPPTTNSPHSSSSGTRNREADCRRSRTPGAPSRRPQVSRSLRRGTNTR